MKMICSKCGYEGKLEVVEEHKYPHLNIMMKCSKCGGCTCKYEEEYNKGLNKHCCKKYN